MFLFSCPFLQTYVDSSAKFLRDFPFGEGSPCFPRCMLCHLLFTAVSVWVRVPYLTANTLSSISRPRQIFGEFVLCAKTHGQIQRLHFNLSSSSLRFNFLIQLNLHLINVKEPGGTKKTLPPPQKPQKKTGPEEAQYFHVRPPIGFI